MTVERTFHCDGPECERHVKTLREFPPAFVTVLEGEGLGFDYEGHFCGWDCVLKFAAQKEPEQILEDGASPDAL